jgi:hypothetical protein
LRGEKSRLRGGEEEGELRVGEGEEKEEAEIKKGEKQWKGTQT